MPTTNRTTYRALRSAGSSAKHALDYARRSHSSSIVFDWQGDTARTTFRGYDVVAYLEPDGYPDLSWLGKFSEQWAPGAIDRKAAGVWSRNEFRYFIPEMSEHQYARQDWRRAESFARGDVGMYVVQVTVSRHGVELGRASLVGVESDSGSYLTEVANELLHEAVAEAEQKVALLQERP